ncbi:SEFIR domain-containing protein [Lentzea sp. NPDC051208]|uniref:SEFIR domain-containing protein n=1 Tax=Lentzea sp. NPDC051208 TaxID=3154642 RepID=UPI0034439CC9
MAPTSPRVFVSYADDSGEHTETVRRFARRLRSEFGIDVRLDQWEREQRRDWCDWVVEQIEQGDFVLAIASPEYRRLAGPDGAAGGNARFQLAILREHLAADRPRWLPRILPVVLPGCSADDLPAFLQPHSATCYAVPGQLDELLRVLTGQPRHVSPELAPPAAPAVLSGDALLRTTPVDAELSQVLVKAADRLAGSVADLWRGEVERLGLADPRPLATRLTAGGVTFDRIGAFFRLHVPTRRLLVLGGPASGKSVSAIRLVSDELAARTAGGPVPVLVPVTDWNPDELHAFDWLAGRLIRDHRLGQTVRWVDGRRITLASALLEVGLVLPVLDGLETIAGDLRPRAVAALNRLGSSVPLVVTCGLAEYQELEAVGSGLVCATRAELLPPDRDDVEQYLTEAVPRGAARLGPLFARLRAEPVPTPLVVWLIRVVHQRLDQDPDELCDRARFPGLAAIEAHLLAHLIPAVYPDDPPRRTRSSARPSFTRLHHTAAQRWFAHLARHLDATGLPDLAWWRLHRSVPWAAPACRAAGGAAMGYGIMGNAGPLPGLVAAVMLGFLVSNRRYLEFAGVRDLETPHALTASAPRLRAEMRVLARSLGTGLLLVAGLLALLTAAVGLSSDLPHTIRSVLVLSALVVVGVSLLGWSVRALWRQQREDRTDGLVGLADLARPTSPAATVRADRAVVVLGAGTMLGIAAVFAVLGIWYAVHMTLGFAAAWALFSAYARFTAARLALAARGRLPWRLGGSSWTTPAAAACSASTAPSTTSATSTCGGTWASPRADRAVLAVPPVRQVRSALLERHGKMAG